MIGSRLRANVLKGSWNHEYLQVLAGFTRLKMIYVSLKREVNWQAVSYPAIQSRGRWTSLQRLVCSFWGCSPGFMVLTHSQLEEWFTMVFITCWCSLSKLIMGINPSQLVIVLHVETPMVCFPQSCDRPSLRSAGNVCQTTHIHLCIHVHTHTCI